MLFCNATRVNSFLLLHWETLELVANDCQLNEEERDTEVKMNEDNLTIRDDSHALAGIFQQIAEDCKVDTVLIQSVLNMNMFRVSIQ